MKYLYKLAKYIFILVFASCSFSPVFAYYDSRQEDETPYIPTILIVENDEEADSLISSGVIIWHRREDMALALVPNKKSQEVSRLSSNAKVLKNKMVKPRPIPTMDIAKTYLGASDVLAGNGLDHPYTGKGVVVGFCDTGFDPHHINFLDSQGKTRVKRLVYYDEPQGIRVVMDKDSEIASWTSDSEIQTHATHVAGIMTGSYSANGYSGMAPDAEIVGVTSQLYDAGILSACEDIIEYARSVGKPAVINLSVGSYNGPHDGSTLFNRYMSLLGQEAIICMASGNEGNKDNTYRITFNSYQPDWRVRVHASNYTQFDMYGLTDIWSSDSRPVGVKFHIYDEVTQQSVYSSPLLDGESDYPFIISNRDDMEFSKYMEGEVIIDAGVDEHNGRWSTEVYYDTHTDISNPNSGGNWARYNIALEICGENGVHADVTADSQYSRLMAWPGYSSPNSDLSVSDISTGDNVICVGMYNNRSEVPTIDGNFKATGYEPFEIRPASGYATLIDGRVLPHSVAPGGCIISSANSRYIEANPEKISDMNAMAEVNGKKYYWNLNSGTSMSTPYLAGVVATWLEADPTLNVDDIKKILEATNNKTVFDNSDPRNGGGWLQPYEGLKMVIANSGITSGKVDAADVSIMIRGDRAEILNPSGNLLTARIFKADGMMVSSRIIDASVGSVDLSELDRGIYIISVSGGSQKPVIRKFVRS